VLVHVITAQILVVAPAMSIIASIVLLANVFYLVYTQPTPASDFVTLALIEVLVADCGHDGQQQLAVVARSIAFNILDNTTTVSLTESLGNQSQLTLVVNAESVDQTSVVSAGTLDGVANAIGEVNVPRLSAGN
jgi:hypothetical protein